METGRGPITQLTRSIMASTIIGFDKFSVQIYKDQTLGIGFFGKVCKAKCGELICAAKILHPTLFDSAVQNTTTSNKECILPIRRFEQECEFLRTIKHPNIVQYLILHHDPDTGLPVIVMELMDASLTKFLNSCTCPVPYHIEVNLSHDIVLALSYLHSNNILHRDLSGNNVLLIGNARAKLSDFGMAKLSDLRHRSNRLSLTLCPGTDVYMPPEAMDDHPKYTEKIDCFSFGVIVIQILSRQAPKPGDRNKVFEINHPEIPNETITCKVPVPEIERRKCQIAEARSNHPLLPVAKDCLKDKDSERPSADELCRVLAFLKGGSEYQESSKVVETNLWSRKNDQEIEDLRKQLAQKDDTISAKMRENKHLSEKLELVEEEKMELLKKRNDKEIEDLQKQLVQKEDTICANVEENQRLRKQLEQYKEEKIGKLEQNQYTALNGDESDHKSVTNKSYGTSTMEPRPISKPLLLARSEEERKETAPLTKIDHSKPHVDVQKHESKTESQIDIQLTWKTGQQPPYDMYSSSNAIGDGDCIYIRPGGLTLNQDREGRLIHKYNVKEDRWSVLPKCHHRHFSIAMVKGSLTAIGGYYMYDAGGPVAIGYRRVDTNDLLCLNTEKNPKRPWYQGFPPMPTKRSDTSALTTASYLIVVGGQLGLDNNPTGTVQLHNVEVMNIDTRTWSTAAHLPSSLVRHSISVTTCEGSIYLFGVQHIFSCSLVELLESCSIDSTTRKEKAVVEDSQVWKFFSDSPVTESTGVSIGGQLLAIGGRAVLVYQPTKNCWDQVGHMTMSRSSCSAAAVSCHDMVVIVGGNIGKHTMEIAVVNIQ